MSKTLSFNVVFLIKIKNICMSWTEVYGGEKYYETIIIQKQSMRKKHLVLKFIIYPCNYPNDFTKQFNFSVLQYLKLQLNWTEFFQKPNALYKYWIFLAYNFSSQRQGDVY